MRLTTIIPILLILFCESLIAAHFRDNNWLAEAGVLESIRIEPRLPAQGEAFTVNLSGSWAGKNPDGSCRAPITVADVAVLPGNRVQLTSNLEPDPGSCDQPPAQWSIDVAVPASAWDAVTQEGFLLIEHLMFSGINMLTGIEQVFDMRLGTHEVPAFLGAGFWISDAHPFEGVMIEQQGERVLFYGLAYDRDTSTADAGEPVWRMVSGEMYGDSTLGRSYRYDWPVGGDLPPEDNPAHDDLLTFNESGAIIVDDYNHLRIFTQLEEGIFARYSDFYRFTFGAGQDRLPVYVPPLGGRWTLHGFENQQSVFTAELDLLEGESPAANQYRFDSAAGDWFVICTMDSSQIGECTVERSSDGAKFNFTTASFQGNLARGALQTENDASLNGILLRHPWTLPVLER